MVARLELFVEPKFQDSVRRVVADIRQSDRITHVMLGGRVYETATMNEVGATPKARKPFYFEGAEGASVPVQTWTHGHSHGKGDTHGQH